MNTVIARYNIQKEHQNNGNGRNNYQIQNHTPMTSGTFLEEENDSNVSNRNSRSLSYKKKRRNVPINIVNQTTEDVQKNTSPLQILQSQ